MTSTATCRRSRPCWPRSRPTWIVVGGDVGPARSSPNASTLLAPLDARYVMGNGDRELIEPASRAATRRPRSSSGAASGSRAADRDRLAAFEPTVSVDGVLVCHGSPRSDTEIITAVSPRSGSRRCSRVVGRDRDRLRPRAPPVRPSRCSASGCSTQAASASPYEDEAAAYRLSSTRRAQLRRTDDDIAAAGRAPARLRRSPTSTTAGRCEETSARSSRPCIGAAPSSAPEPRRRPA